MQFAELRDHVKRKLRDPLVITSPGVPCDEAYLAQAVSNVTCVFVNNQGFDRFELPATLKAYDPSRFAAMPYNIADVETMRTVVKEAIVKRIGYLYVSDAKTPSEWGKLPAYWEAEVERGVPPPLANRRWSGEVCVEPVGPRTERGRSTSPGGLPPNVSNAVL